MTALAGWVTARPPRRCAVLPEAVEKARPWTAPSDHRQAAELRGGAPHSHAVSDAQHAAIREQSSRGVSPADPAARTTDAEIYLRCARATVPVGARRRVESVSCRSSPATCRPPSPVAHPGLRGLAGGDVCLNRRAESSPHRLRSLFVRRQLDSASYGAAAPPPRPPSVVPSASTT